MLRLHPGDGEAASGQSRGVMHLAPAKVALTSCLSQAKSLHTARHCSSAVKQKLNHNTLIMSHSPHSKQDWFSPSITNSLLSAFHLFSFCLRTRTQQSKVSHKQLQHISPELNRTSLSAITRQVRAQALISGTGGKPLLWIECFWDTGTQKYPKGSESDRDICLAATFPWLLKPNNHPREIFIA